MKTTLNLPDDLMRAVKLRAVEEDRTLTDTIAELLRMGLARAQAGSSQRGNRVQLPLVKRTHQPEPGEELTPERVAEILLEEEAGWQRDLMR
jgi:hypothetical protein